MNNKTTPLRKRRLYKHSVFQNLVVDLFFYTFTTEMKEMQFSIVVMTILMCSALVLLMPGRVKRDVVINHSRWLMVGALMLIGAQFLIQYITQLRTIGVTQAVLVNLTVLLPASALMDLSVLNLQRQGQLSKFEKWCGAGAWLIVVTVLAVTVLTDGNPLRKLSERVHLVEIGLSLVYAAMQLYYSILQFRELERTKEAIANYYDSEHKGLTQWMKYAIAVNGLLAVLVPLLIFGSNTLLSIFSLSFFWGIFMMWFSFVRYFTSNAINRMREAEENAEECAHEEKDQKTEEKNQMTEDGKLSDYAMKHINHALERWIATGNYLNAGITSSMAAEAMGIPRYQLTAWVKASGHNSFSQWITSMRVEEAKRVLQEHPDWTNEAVADHCGFSRAYFQKIFKKETGISPTEFGR